MYELHYDYVENKYDKKSKLLFTETDSLMYEIKTEDVYEDCSNDFSVVALKGLNYMGYMLVW